MHSFTSSSNSHVTPTNSIREEGGVSEYWGGDMAAAHSVSVSNLPNYGFAESDVEDLYVMDKVNNDLFSSEKQGVYYCCDNGMKPIASPLSCGFNLVNNIIGGGVLSLPFVMASSGLFAGTLLLLGVAILSSISSYLMLEASKYASSKSYAGVFRAAFGTPGAIGIDLVMVTFLFGTLTAYMVIIGDVLPPLLHYTSFIGTDILSYRPLVITTVSIVFVFPLCCLKSVNALRFTSLLAIICIFYIVLVISIHGGMRLLERGLEQSFTLFDFSIGIVKSFPVVSFAFTFHPNLFLIFTEMRKPSIRRIMGIVSPSMVLVFTLYLIVGFLGYLAFLDETKGNIFNNYNANIAANVGKAALSLVIIFSYPLLHFAARASLDSAFRNLFMNGRSGSKVSQWIRHFAFAICLVFCSTSLGILVRDVELVFGFVGATAGCFIVYISPSLLYIILIPGKFYTLKKIPVVIFCAAGCIFAIISLIAQIISVTAHF